VISASLPATTFDAYVGPLNVIAPGKVVSSTGKTVEEGAHKENILKQEIKPCKLG
jgi:hypothetical protein